jgi:hypothetical protein
MGACRSNLCRMVQVIDDAKPFAPLGVRTLLQGNGKALRRLSISFGFDRPRRGAEAP